MSSGASILERIIEPQKGGLSAEHARYILSLDFSAQEHAHYEALTQKLENGSLTVEERAELEGFVAANALLTILQSKARVLMKKQNPAA